MYSKTIEGMGGVKMTAHEKMLTVANECLENGMIAML